MKSNKQEIVTFGCRLNQYESEIIRKNAEEVNLQNTTIINTCAVTNSAVRQSRQKIRNIKKNFPNKKIIVTGCAAQIDPDSFSNMKEVDFVIGNEEKLNRNTLKKIVEEINTKKTLVNDIMSVKTNAPHLLDFFEDRARAFVQIQNGCDHRCTFCVIPYGRGNARSVDESTIIKQINLLTNAGYNEIVLTGVDITSYGIDLPNKSSLGKIVKKILKECTQLKRLCLSSIDFIELDEDLIETFSDNKILPYLHLSIQSGDNIILKRMKRRHLREDIINFCKKIREIRKDIILGADIIAGFPTETDLMFENTMDIINKCNITLLHVFPYSPKKGTPAALMPQVSSKKIKIRAEKIRAIGEKKLKEYLERQVGSTKEVLIEKGNLGRTENYNKIYLEKRFPTKSIIKAKVMSVNQNSLIGISI